MEILITAALFLLIGATIATCYWVNYMRARDEGYRRGYAQANYEHQMIEEAMDSASNVTLFGQKIDYND